MNPVDGLEYVWIPPGKFTMGCSAGDLECFDDETRHGVAVVRGFWLGRTEVTAGAYGKFPKHRTESAGGSGDLPVVNVNWSEAQAFCKWTGGRLPTEEEWEYAARAGSTGSRYAALDSVAWYVVNSERKLHPVAGKEANAWGLFDMLGNAWEWVESPKSLLRGGCFSNDARYARASKRYWIEPENRDNGIGFRCARGLD